MEKVDVSNKKFLCKAIASCLERKKAINKILLLKQQKDKHQELIDELTQLFGIIPGGPHLLGRYV
jgi:hypothetical protein